jgi:hypothetical protein
MAEIVEQNSTKNGSRETFIWQHNPDCCRRILALIYAQKFNVEKGIIEIVIICICCPLRHTGTDTRVSVEGAAGRKKEQVEIHNSVNSGDMEI